MDQAIPCTQYLLAYSPYDFLPLLFTPATSIFLQSDTVRLHSYAQDAQTISICKASPHQPHSEYPNFEKTTIWNWTFYPSMTLHSTHPSHYLPSPIQTMKILFSSPRFHPHRTIHSEHIVLCIIIFFPLHDNYSSTANSLK